MLRLVLLVIRALPESVGLLFVWSGMARIQNRSLLVCGLVPFVRKQPMCTMHKEWVLLFPQVPAWFPLFTVTL